MLVSKRSAATESSLSLANLRPDSTKTPHVQQSRPLVAMQRITQESPQKVRQYCRKTTESIPGCHYLQLSVLQIIARNTSFWRAYCNY